MRKNLAFTLVELLTVIVIISMLAAISLFAMNGAYEEAKIAKTRGTIQKLDVAIQQIFEGYEEKFETLSVDKRKLAAALSISAASVTSTQTALAKLHFIRDTMRMEMPDSWAEVRHNWNASSPLDISRGPIPIIIGSGTPYQADPPAVLQYYRRAESQNVSTGGVEQSSELLYLIIANLNPEALENFHGSEIGDLDGDGLPEFLDAWGKPIMFIRWAPGFTGSDKQPDVVTNSFVLGVAGTNLANWLVPTKISDVDWATPPNILITKMKDAAINHHDPFDPQDLTRSWFLYPLIYSAGADKLDDTSGPITLPGNVKLIDTSVTPPLVDIYDPFAMPTGLPEDIDPDNPNNTHNGVLNHYDNIHNHRQAGGF